ncbi:hypothetical protein EVAR_83376_1 [Eumeta japonica]|uniref:Uncharacterized protein n=1 Tax=Eumeta variegata TaxID=151549 RepID=A0A4C1TZ21_EUMVA|nr:hypothetical protein EVAR_83376_1 [Eumeta japonica]
MPSQIQSSYRIKNKTIARSEAKSYSGETRKDNARLKKVGAVIRVRYQNRGRVVTNKRGAGTKHVDRNGGFRFKNKQRGASLNEDLTVAEYARGPTSRRGALRRRRGLYGVD